MPIRHLIAAVGAALIGLTSQSIAADFYALSDDGRMISLVDIDTQKVTKSANLAKTDQLTTITYVPDFKEVWGLTVSKSLIRMKAKNFEITFRSEPIPAIKLETPFLDYFTEQTYIVLSNKKIVSVNSDGTIGEPFDAFRNPKGSGFPTLAAFTFLTNKKDPNNSIVYGIDGEKSRLLGVRLGSSESPVWQNGPELSKKVSVPTAFETIRENGNNKAFAVLGNTLWSVNVSNGDFTKPRELKGLTGEVTALAFITEAVAPPEMASK